MASKRRYFKQLRLNQFRAIIELSRTKGFSAAATNLDLATPSVWQQIRALEDEFKVPLVEVTGHQVNLTRHGSLLVDLAEPVVEGFDSIVEQFTIRSDSMNQRLSVAAPANILINELPVAIRRFHSEHEHVELNLIDLPSNPARQMLESGEVDLAVVGQLDSSYSKMLVADRITSFPFMLVCALGHPILAIKRLGPRSIARYPLVMSNVGTNTRRRVDEVFAKAGLLQKLRIACETSTKDLQMQYVQMGLGLAIAPISPRYRAKSRAPYGDIRGLAFRDVSSLFGDEQIVVFRRRHRYESPQQYEFRKILLENIVSDED